MIRTLIIVTLGFLLTICDSTTANNATTKPKVIIYSFAIAHSHVQFDCSLARWAKEAGFQVDALYVVPRFAGDAPFCPEAIDKEYRIWMPDINFQTAFNKILTYGRANMLSAGLFEEFREIMGPAYEAILNDKETFEAIKNQKYDIGISEIMGMIPIAYFYKAGVRSYIAGMAIPMSSMNSHMLGLPNTPSFTTDVMEPITMHDPPTLSEKLQNLHVAYLMLKLISTERIRESTLCQKAFNDSSLTAEAMYKYVSLTVINTPLLVTQNRPTTNAVLHIGDALVRPPKPLTGKLAELLETSTKKVVYVSFGTFTMSHLFPQNFRTALLGAFEALPEYDFIWKAPLTEDPGLPNVHVFEWVDQVSLLANKNLSLFYTHCGQNSLNEAIVNGVPIVGTPVLGDQLFNCEVAIKHGLGIQALLLTLTKEELITALKTVIEDPTYAANAKLLARKIQKQPLKPKEVFQGWLWYLAEFGDMKELQLASISMSFTEYYSLEIIIPGIILALVSFAAVAAVGLSIVRTIWSFGATAQKTKLS